MQQNDIGNELSNAFGTDHFIPASTHADAQPTVYRMRCPSCRKLYSVEPRLIQGISDPRFECVACQTHFSISVHAGQSSLLETRAIDGAAPVAFASPAVLADAEVSAPVAFQMSPMVSPATASMAAPMIETRACPKCGTQGDRGASECLACGIVFSRYRPGEGERVAGEIELTGKVELVNLWDAVIADYEDVAGHEEFVGACFEAGCLPFASQKYARVLAGAPDNEIARKMRKRIVGLATAKFERSELGSNAWRFSLPSFNNFIILLGVILLIVGLGLPRSHDIAGVGIAMLALAAGLRVFTRRPA